MQTERQKEIIQVSLDLISEKGIQGLTIKNIASKIGTSEPAIYRHYENKIHILLSILDSFRDFSQFAFKEELSKEIDSVDKEGIFANEELLIAKISGIMTENQEIMHYIIIQGQLNNEIRSDIDPQTLSTIIMGSLRLFVKKWQFSKHSFDLIKEGESLINSIKTIIK